MKPVMAKWMLLWLEANHVAGIRTDHMMAYITRDCSGLVGTAWDDAVEAAAAQHEAEMSSDVDLSGRRAAPKGTAAHAQLRLHAMLRLKLAAKELSSKAMQLINLTEEWLSTFLPHCLQKVWRWPPRYRTSPGGTCRLHNVFLYNSPFAAPLTISPPCC